MSENELERWSEGLPAVPRGLELLREDTPLVQSFRSSAKAVRPLVLRWKWNALRPVWEPFVLGIVALLLGGVSVAMVFFGVQHKEPCSTTIGAFFSVVFYTLMQSVRELLQNETMIVCDEETLSIRTRPKPQTEDQTLACDSIAQFLSHEEQNPESGHVMSELRVKLVSGEVRTLIKQLQGTETSRFLQAALNRQLGLDRKRVMVTAEATDEPAVEEKEESPEKHQSNEL